MGSVLSFPDMKQAVEARLMHMIKNHNTLFVVDVSKEHLWQTYLSSFPEGTNPIYKTRTEHDCNCCKQFVTNVGNVVSINNGVITSIWDIVVKDGFQHVANALSALVKSAPIKHQLLLSPSYCVFGQNNTRQLVDGKVINWNHFHANMTKYADIDFASKIGSAITTIQVFERSLTELTPESIDTVLELINQNSLYRGSEFKSNLQSFKQLQAAYEQAPNKNLFLWETFKKNIDTNNSFIINVMMIRNRVIGTLLIDLSDPSNDLEQCVRKYEKTVAPENYQRPTALVTSKMIDQAREKLKQLGLENALYRRYARLSDLTVDNLLFVDKNIKPEITMDVFDVMQKEATQTQQVMKNIDTVSIDQFVQQILPTAKKVEVLFESKHQNNLVSLIAPVDTTSPKLFSWNNNFSWSYIGGVTDSIKERVKAQGGKVDGDLRISLSWFNKDDLDLHVIEPDGNEIFFGSKRSRRTHGELDVDMNAFGTLSSEAVENVIYKSRQQMIEGTYKVIVNNFNQRQTNKVGFEIEIEFDGEIHTISYDKAVKSRGDVTVCCIKYDKAANKFSIHDVISKHTSFGGSSKEVWNINTAKFHRVNAVMLSPNYWDNENKGNKHFMFMIDCCRNTEGARGIYNEFLRGELKEHRKVFEIVGSKMTSENDDCQLSGLGFSSTKKDSFVCRVTGAFTRTLKVNI